MRALFFTLLTAAATMATVTVRFTAKSAERLPATATLVISGTDGVVWRATLSRRDVQRPVVARIPIGAYTLRAAAPHFEAKEIALPVESGAPRRIEIALTQLPVISGRVVERASGSPLPGAVIASGGETLAITSGDGRFSFDARPNAWPSTITIAAAGYGTAVVAVPRARTTTPLPDVELSTGAALRVTVTRPETVGALALRLLKRDHDSIAGSEAVAAATIEAGSTEATLDGLEPGDYVLILSGEGEWRRLGRKISLKAGATADVAIEIAERPLRLHVEMAQAALPRAHLRIDNWEGLWNAAIDTDDGGDAVVPVWQLGRFSASVWADALTSPHSERATIAEGDRPSWTISVSSRELTGTVVDAETGTPVPDATLALRSRSGRVVTGTADANGRFRFTALPPGEQMVMAAADGYLDARMSTMVGELDGEKRDVTIQLSPAAQRTIVVRDRAGQPLGGVMVMDFQGAMLTGQRVTDAGGRVTIPLPRNGQRDIYVIPRDGAFVIARLVAATHEELDVAIPEAPASIVVRAESADREPIPNVWVIVRYNGVVLPMEALQQIARVQGGQPFSGADGRLRFPHVPAGLYELWPVGSQSEMLETIAGLGSSAPVTIAAQAGMNAATLRFKPRK